MLQLEHPFAQLAFLDSAGIKNRQDLWQAFVQEGFPTKKTESWRYTDLDALYKKHGIKTVKLQANIDARSVLSLVNLNMDAHNIVFVDGVLLHCDQVEGLTVKGGLSSQEITIAGSKNALSLLNASSTLAGTVIELKENIKLAKPILMTYLYTKDSSSKLVNYHNSIIVQKSSACTIAEHHIMLGEEFSAANIVTDVTLQDFAQCTYDVLANMSLQKLLITHKLSISIGCCAQYETFQLGAYAALNRVEFEIDLMQEGASFDAKGIYTLAASAKADYRFNVKHLASNTQSDILFRGVVGDKASATFNAKAYVAHGLYGVKALQNNRNIQLSNTAEINTKPELEIYSDDVICNHGATIGQLDQQALFYLESRGIPKAQAMSLLISGFAKALIMLLKRDETTLASYIASLEAHIKDLLH
ncbi:Fe-S cluster assembly protein SufD [Caedibacter taeniospiralis]|uniref:Fe-S cluster assembly protein SufD n=1 Tax=Caedibacter taeniospiralis TaxID=28907 RepID=UPI0013029F3F|nr:Fe-S cluster assembly protein SufD [Caedibacter taeniospiralis]